MNSLNLTIGLNLLAERLLEKEPERLVRCLCTYCLEELDPLGETNPKRYDPGECQRCGDPVREREGGCVLVVMDRSTLGK